MELAFIIVFFIVVGVIAWVLLKREMAKKRAAETEAWARSVGWNYVASDPYLPGQLDGPDFRKGHAHEALDVVSGMRGPTLAVSADYQFKTTSHGEHGDSTKVHPITVAGFQLLPERPPIAVTPRSTLGRVVKMVSRDQVLTGDSRFDSAFRIDVAYGREARALLTQPVREYCLSYPKQGFSISGDWVYTWRKARRDIKGIEEEFRYLDGLVARLPVVYMGRDPIDWGDQR